MYAAIMRLARESQTLSGVQPALRSRTIDRHEPDVHAEIAGSRLSVLTATGHVPILSAPDQVVAEMRAYLS